MATLTSRPLHIKRPDSQKTVIPGGAARVKLELKLLADVGIIGFPNVGKSSLIAAVSAVRPKIADYPFTTLIPNLGVVKVDDNPEHTFVMADIPGIDRRRARGSSASAINFCATSSVLGCLIHVHRCRWLVTGRETRCRRLYGDQSRNSPSIRTDSRRCRQVHRPQQSRPCRNLKIINELSKRGCER